MLYYQEQKWDRHRTVYLKIGFILSLFISFVFFNAQFELDLSELNRAIWEDPHLDLSPLINSKIQSPESIKRKQIKAPKKESFILKIDSILLNPTEDSLEVITTEPINVSTGKLDTSAMNPPKINPPEPEKDDFLLIAEQMPVFGNCTELIMEEERNACSNERLIAYLYEKIKYPKRALTNGVEGMVIAQIIIDKNGKVRNTSILKGIGKDCDDEVLRILNSMPVWNPGRQNGRKVEVQMKIPVHFKIR